MADMEEMLHEDPNVGSVKADENGQLEFDFGSDQADIENSVGDNTTTAEACAPHREELNECADAIEKGDTNALSKAGELFKVIGKSCNLTDIAVIGGLIAKCLAGGAPSPYELMYIADKIRKIIGTYKSEKDKAHDENQQDVNAALGDLRF